MIQNKVLFDRLRAKVYAVREALLLAVHLHPKVANHKDEEHPQVRWPIPWLANCKACLLAISLEHQKPHEGHQVRIW